jgi:hypothetical protein
LVIPVLHRPIVHELRGLLMGRKTPENLSRRAPVTHRKMHSLSY